MSSCLFYLTVDTFFSPDTYTLKTYTTCWSTETTPLNQYRGSPIQKNTSAYVSARWRRQLRQRHWGTQSLGSSMKRCVSGLRLPPRFLLPHRRWGTQPEDRINKSTDAASSFHSIPLMNNTGHLPPTPPTSFKILALSACAHIEKQMKNILG